MDSVPGSNPARTLSTWPRCGITSSGGIRGSPGGQASALSLARVAKAWDEAKRGGSASPALPGLSKPPTPVDRADGSPAVCSLQLQPSLVPRLRASGNSFLTIASNPCETSHPWFRPATRSHSFRLRNYPKGLPVTTPFLTSKSFKCNLLTDLVGTVWHL